MTSTARNDEVFVPARPRDVASRLDATTIHLWWLPYQRDQRRAPLRELLATYLDVTAAGVTLIDDEHGRPRLAGPGGIDFNWSHSADHALVAIAHDLPALGVDIEHARARPHALALAERFFSAAECAALRSQPPARREVAFMRLWTAKEAVLKAHGRGIAYGLERVTFALDATHAQPSRFEGDIGGIDQWQFHPLDPTPDFIGMLAWRGPHRRIRPFKMGSDPISPG